ncbi:MAG TPA: hypothetical protein PLR24_02880, partial [Saprospiraceae bacterium]|nr:hypothetical protein [Saprospiraceae bacterium]
RGEAIISKANFEKVNQQRLAQGQPLFANARNAATGGLRTKDRKIQKAGRWMPSSIPFHTPLILKGMIY